MSADGSASLPEVYLDLGQDADGEDAHATGFVLAGGSLVLTGAHCVDGVGEVHVLRGRRHLCGHLGETCGGARVVWRGSRNPKNPGEWLADLALVQLGHPVPVDNPVGLALVDRESYGELAAKCYCWPTYSGNLPVTLAGRLHPRARGPAVPGHSERWSSQMEFEVNLGQDAGNDWLHKLETGSQSESQSPWAGASGGGVVAQDFDGSFWCVGVISGNRPDQSRHVIQVDGFDALDQVEDPNWTPGAEPRPDTKEAFWRLVLGADRWGSELDQVRKLPKPAAPAEPQPRADAMLPSGLWHHDRLIASLRGYRSRLASSSLAFVPPDPECPWSPTALWALLRNPDRAGSVLLTGHGGAGKTRTMLEVANVASADGWEVIHLRSADAALVAPYLTDRVLRSSGSPILLVIDYLNLARELDIMAVIELANQSRSPEPRLSILASSRSGWDRRHARDPGMDRFNRVRLEPANHEIERTCRSIVEQVAPRASAEFGTDRVLSITGGSKPILAVLLGQIAEDQFTTNRTLPAALVSEDLAKWLEDRLFEDELISPPGDENAEVDARLLQSAAALATAPASGVGIVRSISSVMGSPEILESAQVTVQKLVRLGWMVDTGGLIAAAHDVVVDKLVESITFYDGTDIVRASIVGALLSSIEASATAFGNVLAALERVLDEREPQSQASTSLVHAADAWIEQHLPRICSQVSNATIDAGRVAVQLLNTSVWSANIQTRWESLVAPIVQHLADSVSAMEPLLVASQLAPRGTSPSVPELALAWLDTSGDAFSDQLLQAIMKRRDLTVDQSETAIRLALYRVRTSDDIFGRQYLLTRLFKRAELSGDHLTDAVTEAHGWLAQYGTSWTADHLLNAILTRSDVGETIQANVRKIAQQWVGSHPAAFCGHFVLQALLDSTVTGQGDPAGLDKAQLWQDSSNWLSLHPVAAEASFVLQALVRWPLTLGSRVDVVSVAAATWLQANPTTPEASYLLQALIGWAETTGKRANTVWATAATWLQANPTTPEASYLLHALIDWAETTGERADTVVPAATTWLQANPTTRAANLLLQALIGWAETNGERAETVVAAAATWLQANPTTPAANYLLQALIGWAETTGKHADTAWATASTWLQANPTTPEANYVLQALIGWAETTGERAESVVAAAATWLQANPATPAANYLLQALIGWAETTGERAETVVAAAATWLQANPTTPEANYVLHALIGWAETAGERAETFSTPAVNWLQANPTTPEASYVLRALIGTAETTGERADTVWPAATTWLQANPTTPDASYVLPALIGRAETTGEHPETVVTAAATWLQANPTTPGARYVLRALIGWAEKNGERANTVWVTATTWLQGNPTTPDASNVLRALISRAEKNGERANTVWATATTWLQANPTTPDARYVLQALIGWAETTGERADTVWAAAATWLQANPTTLTTSYVLPALIGWAETTGERADTVWAAAVIWLQANPTQPRAGYVLRALTDWAETTGKRADTVWAAASTWLQANPSKFEAGYVLPALIGWAETTGERANTVWTAAATWLQANPTKPRASYVLRALIEWAETTGKRADTVWAAAATWLQANPTTLTASYVLPALIGWAETTGERANTVWTAAVTWLQANPTTPAARYLLQALTGWADTTSERANTVVAAATVWLRANPTTPEAEANHALQA